MKDVNSKLSDSLDEATKPLTSFEKKVRPRGEESDFIWKEKLERMLKLDVR